MLSLLIHRTLTTAVILWSSFKIPQTVQTIPISVFTVFGKIQPAYQVTDMPQIIVLSYAYTEKYTVTWKDADGTVLETDTDVPFGTTPTFDGTITVPDGKTLCWTDGTNTYSSNSLPAVTGDVTYTAVFSDVKSLAVGTVFYKGDMVDFGGKYIVWDNYGEDDLYIDSFDSILAINSIVYEDDGYYVNGTYNTGYNLYVKSEDYGTNIGIKVTGGDGTEENPFTFEAFMPDTKHTVTWIGTDGTTVLETDTDVPFGTTPTFDGTITVPDGKTLYWTDGTNTYASNNLPVVTGDVAYTAVFPDVKPIEVGTVFGTSDMVCFGYGWFNYSDWNGEINPDRCFDLITIVLCDFSHRFRHGFPNKSSRR